MLNSIAKLYLTICISKLVCAEDYNVLHTDGSYEFGYENPDSYHQSQANRQNIVRGEFGARDPKTGGIDVTSYTAGPRGFRPRGKNVARKYDSSQVPRGPIGSRDDPYFDPNEDPSYDFQFKTRTYSRKEGANRLGDVSGKYSFVDDVGERHNVEYIAGRRTGFHVKTPFPDSNPRAYGPLFFNGRGRPIPRGRTSVQRGLDGSYRFVAAGPDQRRTETSDSQGNVRGSYTYLDDKGVQHSVHYIAGPQIGYRVLKNVKGPHLPSIYPFAGPNIIPSDFYNYIDRNSEGGSLGGTYGDYDPYSDAPIGRPGRPTARPKPSGAKPRPRPPNTFEGYPSGRPSYGSSEYDEGGAGISDDLFGTGGTAGGVGSSSGTTTNRPTSTGRPTTPGSDDFLGGGSDSGDYDDDGGDVFGSGPHPLVTTSRPITRPSSGPSGRPSGRPTGRPTGIPSISPIRPVTRPTYGDSGSDDLNDDDDDDGNNLEDGLFGNVGPEPTRPPVLSISGGPKTLVTNLGDRTFTVPPGVSVHAHVQSIDLFPYESKVPSPSDQYRAETTNVFAQLADANSTTTTVTTTITSSPTTTVKLEVE